MTDFILQFGDGARSGGLIDQRFFQVLLLLGVEVVVVFGNIGEGLGENLLATDTHLFFAEATFEAFSAALERLEDGLGAGGETALEGSERKADRAFALAVELVGLAHFRLHIIRYRFVERGFEVGEFVIDRVGAALREERCAVELDQLLLHHAAHEVGAIHLVDAVAKLAVEAVGVEQREEQLEVLLLAVVRRGRHQQEMARLRPELFGQLEAARLLQFVTEEVGGELVRLVEHDEIPASGAELLLQVFVARHLVEPNDEVINVLKRIAARGGCFQVVCKDAEFQTELLEHFLAPLIDQAAGGDDDNAPCVGPHDEFADVKARHDGLARARVVSENKPQWLTRQHGFVNSGDLMRERLHIRGVDGHHRVEQKGEINALGLDGELERLAIAIERPGTLGGGNGDVGFISPIEQTFLERAVGRFIKDLHRAVGNRHNGNYAPNAGGVKTGERKAGCDGFEGDHIASFFPAISPPM